MYWLKSLFTTMLTIVIFVLCFLSPNVYGIGIAACPKDSSYQVDCNTCKCNNDGTLGLCTLNSNCPGAKITACPPGAHFFYDCSTCDCQTDGTSSCQAQGESCDETKKCMEGTSWRTQVGKLCKSCTCTKDRKALCIEISCVKKP